MKRKQEQSSPFPTPTNITIIFCTMLILRPSSTNVPLLVKVLEKLNLILKLYKK